MEYLTYHRRANSTLVILCIVAAASLGGFCAYTWLRYRRRHSYPYNASLSVLQFGNINGDKYPDILSYGYRGQSAGNVRWFPGPGSDLDDLWKASREWPFVHYGAFLADLDGDGDADLLSDDGLLMNNWGAFVNVPHDPANDYRDSKVFQNLIMLLQINYSGFTFDLYTCDLNGDENPEIILFSDSETILGVGRKKFDWQFFQFRRQPAASIDRFSKEGAELVFLLPADPELVLHCQKEHIRYRTYASGPPQKDLRHFTGPNRDEFHWLDIDNDGSVELVLCSPNADRSYPFEPMYRATVEVYRDKDGKFILLSSMETENYPRRRCQKRLSRPPFPLFQFVDFDQDRRLDLLCQDRWIYRQQAGLTFVKAVKLNQLEDGGAVPATLYAHDVNADGWPDVVSSFHPNWNIAPGPLLPRVPGK